MPQKPYIIVVGVDFSELADRALQQALEIASGRSNAEIHVLTVQPPAPMGNATFPMGSQTPTPPDLLAASLENLRQHVTKKVSTFNQNLGPRTEGASGRIVCHARIDSPALGIVQFASDLHANLVVIGTHGRNGIARWLMGSVAEVVVRHAHCPVLVIPPHHEEAPVPKIEPPCPECVKARAASGGRELWCEQHRERHGRRHTYHQSDRLSTDPNAGSLLFR